MSVRYDGLAIDWLGYATLRIETDDGRVIYVDPGRYGVLDGYAPGDADLVLVTHGDHFDPDAIADLAGANAVVVPFEGIDGARAELADAPGEVDPIGLGERRIVAGVTVRTVPMYNEPDGEHLRETGEPHHPEGSGAGFLLTVDGVNVLVPGDSDFIEAHRDLAADVFCPPIGGALTMDRHAAAEAAEALGADLVVPTHYDTFGAIEADAEAFAADVRERGIECAVLGPGLPPG